MATVEANGYNLCAEDGESGMYADASPAVDLASVGEEGSLHAKDAGFNFRVHHSVISGHRAEIFLFANFLNWGVADVECVVGLDGWGVWWVRVRLGVGRGVDGGSGV